MIVAEEGPLPGPKEWALAFYSEMNCPSLEFLALADKSKRLYWEGRLGGGQQVRGPRRTALPCGSQSWLLW